HPRRAREGTGAHHARAARRRHRHATSAHRLFHRSQRVRLAAERKSERCGVPRAAAPVREHDRRAGRGAAGVVAHAGGRTERDVLVRATGARRRQLRRPAHVALSRSADTRGALLPSAKRRHHAHRRRHPAHPAERRSEKARGARDRPLPPRAGRAGIRARPLRGGCNASRKLHTIYLEVRVGNPTLPTLLISEGGNMPKIKDLGIKVIPETMKPPEIGGGGGGCTDCTVVQFSICGTTRCGTVTTGCTDCTFQQCSIAGGVTCTDCTLQQCSIAGGVTRCTDCTFQQCSIAGGFTRCTDCTFQQCSIAGGVTRCTDCTLHQCSIAAGGTNVCWCTNRTLVCQASVACRLQTHCGLTDWGGCGPVSPVCAGSIDPTILQQPGVLTREQVSQLKDALKKQITALEEHEKTLGPKTAEEIEAREKQLNDELAMLKERKKTLK